MWNLPEQGLNPCPLHWAGRFLTTRLPWKPHFDTFLIVHSTISSLLVELCPYCYPYLKFNYSFKKVFMGARLTVGTLEDLQDFLELTQKNDACPIHRGLKCKSRKSRDTWSNRQIWPWSTEWSRAKTNRVLPREPTDHSKHPFSTTQEMTLNMDITKWSILKSNWLHFL